MRLAIFGNGGMGREAYDIAVRAYASVPDAPEVVNIWDGGPEALPDDQIILALGSSAARRQVSERFSNYASLIALSAIVSPSAKIGEGALICEQAFIGHSAVIGRQFQCNAGAKIHHDALIGDFVTISPSATICGWVEIGDDVFIGVGAVIRNGTSERRLKVGAGATIAMGAVVVDDVPEGAKVATHRR